MVKIAINTDTEAFFRNERHEVARILQGIVNDLGGANYRFLSRDLRDINGNTVGHIYFDVDG